MKQLLLFALFLLNSLLSPAINLLIEAESFKNKGGWALDQQFMDLMGSPYLMAHGLGKPVADASTEANIPASGLYHVYVRTFNWTSPWHNGAGPGKFALRINNKTVSDKLGTEGKQWLWQKAGQIMLKQGTARIALHDLTGFNGRCDAIWLTTDASDIPPSEAKAQAGFRKKMLNLPKNPTDAGEYDLVVAGGGIAGICAAITASRLGCRVALINDRLVLGGNNSSEIRVHLGGKIETGKYPKLGELIKELGPSRGGNAQPADFYEDDKKMKLVLQEKNIRLFTNYRLNGVKTSGQHIESITAKNIETGEELSFSAPCFSDCTGDGTLGYLAGADFRMGREGRDEFNEAIAPEKGDKLTMGSSVQWYSKPAVGKVKFPEFQYGIEFTETNCERVTMGEWTWETGMNFDQINDFEYIRDYGLLVVFSNWSFLKNHLKDNKEYANLNLDWVAYIAGKRESRRLLGDYILKQDDIYKNVFHEDASFTTTWSIDLHFPDSINSAHFPGKEFKAATEHIFIQAYSVPYRCLYSRNINNLFMAGRNISVSHVALGTVRVMRTTGMMGEVVGMAASLCKKYKATPRQIYQSHLEELKMLMEKGVGQGNLPNNQKYNEGGII
ncbi:MAG: FAD-dependent oxidoreductase [Candidatus Symbiothrix sp.]|jgi:hypothetical protein|nr:FAD-dependent oxidoreductase [Candidatus Symbiothrix sp.]